MYCFRFIHLVDAFIQINVQWVTRMFTKSRIRSVKSYIIIIVSGQSQGTVCIPSHIAK